MGSVKKKLEDFMNQSFDDLKRNNLRQSKSLKYLEGGKTHTIDDIKSKINQFKKLKHESQTEDVLNFDISREALKKYQSTSNASATEKHLNMIPLTKSKSNQLVNQQQQLISQQQQQQKQRQTMTEGSSSSTSFLNINVKNIFKSEKSSSNNLKGKPKIIAESNIPTPKFTNEGAGVKQYIQWHQKPKRSSGSLNFNSNSSNNNSNNEFITGNTSNINDDQNRIKTQINLFVKELNYTTTPNQLHTKINTNTNPDSCIYSKGNKSKRISAPILISNKPILSNNTNSKNMLNPIIYTNNQILSNNNTNLNQNLIINGLDSFQLTDSLRGKNYPNMIMENQSSSSILKYDEIKSIKSSLYAMTNEEIAQLPQEYIDELKDLACLINTVF